MTVQRVGPLALAGVLVTGALAEGQPQSRPYRIGFIGFHSPGLESGMLRPFQTRLHELGWVDALPQRVPFGFHGNWIPDPA